MGAHAFPLFIFVTARFDDLLVESFIRVRKVGDSIPGRIR